MGAKFLLVILDSADPLLMNKWMREGELPNLTQFTRNARTYSLRNVPGFGNGAFWPSFVTGLAPGEHGRYGWLQLTPGSYRLRKFDKKRHFVGKPFWAEIDARGGKVASIDVMRSPPADIRNGMEVFDWLAHDPEDIPHSNPPELIKKLHARYGRDPISSGCNDFIIATGDYASLVKHCYQRADWKADFCQKSLSERNWDLFAVAFTELHDIGHMCWHIHDTTDSNFDRELRSRMGDPCLKMFRHLDAKLETLLSAAGASSTVAVVTGPGFEQRRSSNLLLPEILRRWQFGPPKSIEEEGGRPPATRVRVLYQHLIPVQIRKPIHRARVALKGTKEEREWPKSHAFPLVHNDNAGAIRINLRGREPKGLVEPGAELESTIADLSETLLALRDALSGEPLVKEIVRVAEVTKGSCLDNLPDLFVVWSRKASGQSAKSERIGEVWNTTKALRTGDHSDRGELIIMSRNVVPPDRVGPLTPMEAGSIVRGLCGIE
ncbi:MAG: alkaline phosphatase family protein [Gammaproteobacteria bacterium]|nr:MAG: alkaline phosphatase family protein [Gammaproteobacteria bacterium]